MADGSAIVCLGHPGPAFSIAFTARGEDLLTACADGKVRVFAARNAAAFSPHGSLLATAGPSCDVAVVDSRTVLGYAHLPHESPVRAVAWNPREPVLATGTVAGEARVWAVTDALPHAPERSRDRTAA